MATVSQDLPGLLPAGLRALALRPLFAVSHRNIRVLSGLEVTAGHHSGPVLNVPKPGRTSHPKPGVGGAEPRDRFQFKPSEPAVRPWGLSDLGVTAQAWILILVLTSLLADLKQLFLLECGRLWVMSPNLGCPLPLGHMAAQVETIFQTSMV